MKAIDVSYWQGKNIDWSAVSKSIKFSVIRAGYGQEIFQKDSTFDINYAGCINNDISVIPYHMSYALNETDAKKEATAFLEWVKGKTFKRKFMFYDVETPDQYELGSSRLKKVIDSYADTLQKAGWEVGIYANLTFCNMLSSDWLNKNYKVWVAQYNDKCDYTGKKVMWQYTSKGKITGVSGNVDISECYDTSIFGEKSNEGQEEEMATLKNPNPKASKVETVSYKKYGDTKLTEHFKLHEFRCNDGSDTVKFDWYVVNMLESARKFFEKPINITSAYRTESYNQKIGGAYGSYHTKGRAVDCYISGQSPSLLAKFFESHGMKGVGCYYDSLFVHVDSRTSKFLWKNQSETKVSTHLPTIRTGSSGQDVKDAQRLLNLAGAKLTEDGIFGTNTSKEVKNFQSAKGLDVDGIIGPKTWAALLR